MQTLRRILLLAFFIFPVLGRAEDRCLWLNAATAGGILNGMVDVKVAKTTAAPPHVETANAKSSAGPMSANPTGNAYAEMGVDDAECIFTRTPSGTGELRIQVHTMGDSEKTYQSYAKRCGARGTPLKAIGNEALLCDPRSKGAPEQVIGRVRDRVFVVELSVTDPSIKPPALREQATSAAQIVAGNLF
jgi:hypothetical protein